MPTLAEQYLARKYGSQAVDNSDPYQDYLNQNTGQLTLAEQYLSRKYGYPSLTDEEKSRSVAMTGRELLEEGESPGFMGAFWSGLKSGATLGYAADKRLPEESMTFGEEVAQLTGELAGGILPFGAVSVFTGGMSAPIAGAKWAPKVYQSFNRLGKAKNVTKRYAKRLKEIEKQAKDIGIDNADDLIASRRYNPLTKKYDNVEEGVAKDLSNKYNAVKKKFDRGIKNQFEAESTIKKAQREYIDDLVNRGAKTQAARLSKQVSQTSTGYLAASPRGKVLKNIPGYKNLVKWSAEKWGYKGAAIVDRFANSATTFATVGLISNKPGEGLIDRARDLPKDALMGMAFGAAGIPTIYGKPMFGLPTQKYANPIEGIGLLGLGSFQDYLTGNPDPNMDIKDRLLHGLSLVAFHYAGLGLSNIGIKDKMFNGLVDMGFDTPVAYEMAYNTKFTKDITSQARKHYTKTGSIYVNKNNSKDVISISEFVSEKAADGEQPGYIKYIGVGSDKSGTFAGKNIKQSREKLNRKYKKLDFNDKDLMDDVPIEVRENADAMLEGLKSDTVTIGGEKKWKVSADSHEAKGFEIKQASLNKEQKLEKDYYRQQRKDLEKVSTKNRVFDPTRDVETILKEDAYAKGDLVEWVKNGKEINITAEGEFYPMKIRKTDSEFAYINMKDSTLPPEIGSKIQQVEGKIPLSEIKTVRRTGKKQATATYKLNLKYSNREDGKHYRKLKETSWDDPNELIFNTREAAENYAMENWVGKFESNPTIESKIKLLKAKENTIKESKEYQDFSRAKDHMNRAFKEKEFGDKEIKEVLKVMAPKSEGKVDNMSIREVNRVTDLIKGDDSISFDVFDARVRLEPIDLHSKISSKFGKVLKIMSSKFKETVLGTAAVGDMLGGWGADYSLRSKNHARFRNSVMGLPIGMHSDIQRKLRWSPVSFKTLNQHIHALLDPVTFEGHTRTKEFKKFEKDMQSFKIKNKLGVVIDAIDWVKEKYKSFFDEAAIAQIVSNSYIKDASSPMLKKKAFWQAYDVNGNKIELVDVYKNFELHTAQVNSILEWMKLGKGKTDSPAFGGKPTLINKDGKRVAIDTKKSKHYYVKDYSPKRITQEFFDFINVPDGKALNQAANFMAKNDPNLRKIKSFDERFDMAKTLLKELQNIGNKKNVYGQQYTRVADLPAYLYISRGKGGWGDILQISKENAYKENGNPYKVGETITDINGKKHTVGKSIKIYETDMIDIIENYSSGLAHSTATYYSYGKNGNINGTINQISDGLANQTGDRYYGDWITKVMDSQIYGEKQSMFSNVMRPITRWSAIAGLSSPLSGLKNLMLGNVQNATVFTGRELWKSYLSRDAGLLNPTGGAFRKWRNAKEYTESIGATYQSSFDLHLNTNPVSGFFRRWLPNLGLMRTTEILNRTIAQSIGPYSAEIHIANMANVKNPSTRGVSLNDSRRILRDVLEYSPEQVNQMVSRYRQQLSDYIAIEKKTKGDVKGKHFKFNLNDIERQQAAQQAHVVTQGSGDLAYLPYWMGKGWAKPLTLFYKVAYRITDTVAKNVVKPAVVDGNLVPAMKYMGLSALSGNALFAAYDYIFDEQRSNKFKDLESQWFDYFIRAEGLALFSNAYNEYGGLKEAYYPVPLKNIETVWDNLWDFIEGKKSGSTALGDGVKNIVALYGAAERIVKRAIKEDEKKYDDSKRRQYQFLDAFYPKEDINLDFEDGLTAKTPYYRALRNAFWYNDPMKMAKTYYTSLAFLSHRIMAEKQIPYPLAEKEARDRIKRTIGSLKPIPQSWMKTRGKTGKSRYMEYMNSLSQEERNSENEIESIYREKQQQFYDAISRYKNIYYKKG